MQRRSDVAGRSKGGIDAQPVTAPAESGATGDVLELLALGDEPDLDVVLRRVLRTARRLVGARYAALGMPDGQGGFSRFVTEGISPERQALIGELPRTHGVLGALIDEGPILLDDIRDHPRFSYFPQHHPVLTDFVGVPITHRGGVVGNLFVSGQESGRFSSRDQQALESLAAFAGVAIANADLYARAQELAVVEERTRIARELHDAATQALFGLVLEARAAALTTDDEQAREALRGFERRASSALQELRGLVRALRPSSLERDGLHATLVDHAAALRRAGADVTVEVDTSLRVRLDREHALLRIAQEALHNALRHAPGAPVVLTLQRERGQLLLRVRDRGPGFDVGLATAAASSMGLTTMRERAAEIGARLDITSETATGTSVSVRLPLRARPRG